MLVINGESGSGKTEMAKHAIDYLAFVSSNDSSMSLRAKLSQAQLILEPFGSAPTLLNSSSTRFAKYVEMRFAAADGELESARVHELMLEKSRVVLDFPNERNFLVFYYILAGLDKSTLDKLGLDDIQKHK